MNVAPPADVSSIPRILRDRPVWVCWHVEIRNGKETKVPLDSRTGRHASVSDPETWADFATALDAARRNGWGIGYVFTADDGLTGVDLDRCLHPQTGTLAAWARVVLVLLNSYCEVSPSGTGVKVFLRGTLREGAGRRRGPVEVYSAGRFFTVTGQRLTDFPADVCDRQAELDALMRQLFPPAAAPAAAAMTGPAIADDHELIERAIRARNGADFERLWRGDTSGYPSHSEADLALVSHLAFWTGRDPERIDRLFRQSALYRDKWNRADYRGRTIGQVLN